MNIDNSLFGERLIMRNNAANLVNRFISRCRKKKEKLTKLGGTLYLSKDNQVDFKNMNIVSTISLVYGGVFFSNQTSNVNFTECSISKSKSRIGASFYIGDRSKLNMTNCQLGTFVSEFNMSEVLKSHNKYLITIKQFQQIFRLDGTNAILLLNSSTLLKVENLLFRDYSQQGKLEIRLSFIEFSPNFNLRGIFLLDSESSSCVFSGNVFIFRKKSVKDFDFFLQIYGNSSSLLLQENSMNYNLFPIIVFCKQLGMNQLDFHRIELANFKGAFIVVDGITVNTTVIGKLSITKCKISLIGTDKNFIQLKSKISTIIRETVFLLSIHQTRSILSNSVNAGIEILSDLFIESCQFLSFFWKDSLIKVSAIQASTGMIYSERGGYNNINVIRCLFHLGLKFYTSLLHFEGNVKLLLNQTYLLNNLLNSSSSTLIRIKFQKLPILTMVKSIFKLNRVILGGILNMEGSLGESLLEKDNIYFEFTNNSWEHNIAVNKGGLLYLKIAWENKTALSLFLLSLKNKKAMKENHIKSNKASIGTFLFWEGFQAPSKLNLSNIDLGNAKYDLSPSQSDNDLRAGSSIDYVKISSLNDNNLDSPVTNFLKIKMPFAVEKQVIKNRVVFGTDFYFCLIMFDKYNFFQYTFSENFLNASFGKGKSMLSSLLFNDSNLEISFTFTKGMFCAFKMNFLKNYPEIVGREHQLMFSSEVFTKLFSFMSKEKYYNITIVYKVDECKMGELFDSEFCIPCERDKYSLNTNLKSLVDCITCKDYDNFNCYGGSLRSPKKNYWRLSNDSLNFLRCPSAACKGDEDFYKNFTHRDCLNCFLPTTKHTKLFFSFDPGLTGVGSCKAPYEGYLCTQCRDGFGATGAYKCGDCSSIWIYLKQFFFLAIKLLLFFFTNRKALQNKIEMSSKKSEDLVYNYKNTFLLKILFKHFNMLSVLLALPFNLDDLFSDAISGFVSVSPTESFDVFSFECLLKKLRISLAPVYAKTLLNLAFFLLSLIFFIFTMSNSVRKTSKEHRISRIKKFVRTNGTAICLIFFLDNIVSLVDPYFKILFVTNLGDKKMENFRLLSDFSLESWNLQHKFFVLVISLPCIFVFSVYLPLFLFVKILNANRLNRLNDNRFKKNFSYFIFPYNQNALYFEVIMIYNKLILVLFKSYMSMTVIQDEQKVSVLLFFFYLVGLYTFQTIKKPYNPDNFSALQKIELLSLALSISNALCALIWSLLETKQETVIERLLIVYSLTTNALFFFNWFQMYFGFFKGRLKVLWISMNTTFDRVFKKKKKVSTNALKVPEETEKNFENMYNEEFKRNSELKKEIMSLRRINRNLLETIHFLEEQKSENLTKEHEIKEFNCKNDSHFIQKNLFKNILSSKPKSLNETTELKCKINKYNLGFDFSNHKLKLIIKIFNNAPKSIINSSQIHCHSRDWTLINFKWVSLDQVKIYLKKNRYWNVPPFEEMLPFEFYDTINRSGKSYEVLIRLLEFMHCEKMEWLCSHVSNEHIIPNSNFSLKLNIDKTLRLFNIKGNPSLLQGRIYLNVLLFEKPFIVLDFILEKSGNLKYMET